MTSSNFTDADLEKRKATIAKIDDLYKYADYLSAWESNFLSSIRGQLDRYKLLSEKQEAVLAKLIAKAAERFD